MARLITDAGDFVFRESCGDGKDYYRFAVECLLRNKFKSFLPQFFYCSLNAADISRLQEYIGNHILALEQHIPFDRCAYSNFENEIKIECCEGEVDSEGGYFSIVVMFNFGPAQDDDSNSYFGFESVIDVFDAQKFCAELNSVLQVFDS